MTEQPTKRCPTCEAILPLDAFGKSAGAWRCKPCTNRASREHYHSDAEYRQGVLDALALRYATDEVYREDCKRRAREHTERQRRRGRRGTE